MKINSFLKVKKSIYFVFSIFFLFINNYIFAQVLAQISETDFALSWEECLNEIKKNNPELKAAIARVKSNEANLKVAYGYLAPQINGILNYSENKSSTPYADAIVISQQKRYSAGVSVTQQLFNYSTYGGLDQSKANLEISKIALLTTKANIEYNLKAAFQGVIYAQENFKVTQTIVKLRSENLKLVKLRFESGAENKGAVVVAEAYFKQSKYFNLQAANNLMKTRKQLVQVMGANFDFRNLNVLGNIPDNLFLDKRVLEYSINDKINLNKFLTLKELTDKNLSNINFKELAMQTPSYKNAVANELLAKSEVELAKAGFTPSANATGSFTKIDKNSDLKNENWSVGANINIPLFSGLSSIYNLSSANLDLEASKQNKQSVLLSVELDLLTKYLDYVEAFEQMKVAQSFYEAEILRSKIAKSQYLNGFLNYTQWDLINDNYVNRTQSYIQSKFNLEIKKAIWLQTLGISSIN